MVPGEEGTANSVPAAAVIQRCQALFGFIGRKGCVGGPRKSGVKSRGLTPERHSKLQGWRSGEVTGMLGVAVKCVDIERNTRGESESLDSI